MSSLHFTSLHPSHERSDIHCYTPFSVNELSNHSLLLWWFLYPSGLC